MVSEGKKLPRDLDVHQSWDTLDSVLSLRWSQPGSVSPFPLGAFRNRCSWLSCQPGSASGILWARNQGYQVFCSVHPAQQWMILAPEASSAHMGAHCYLACTFCNHDSVSSTPLLAPPSFLVVVKIRLSMVPASLIIKSQVLGVSARSRTAYLNLCNKSAIVPLNPFYNALTSLYLKNLVCSY